VNVRRADIQVFSLSFLDALSCALGGVLLLWIIAMQNSETVTKSFEEQTRSMQQQMNQAEGQLQQALDDLQQAEDQSSALADAQKKLKAAQATLVGIKGDMKAVVFVFDTSGSMSEGGRFDEYRSMLGQWIEGLDFERFNVVQFSTDVRPWKRFLVDGSTGNRAAARQFMDGFQPSGVTNTFEALRTAMAYEGVDTIVLMSDGAPWLGEDGPTPEEEIQRVLEWARTNNTTGVTVNTVAMGNYFEQAYGAFLQRLAHDNNGMFIGR
jgi:hypothetical protein